jgi:predicted DNA-binding antitoxin AbrB/MazE fold protein
MKTLITTKFENGNIQLPKNLEIKNGSKLFINIIDNDLDVQNLISQFYNEEIEDSFEEIDRIYNKNNLIF